MRRRPLRPLPARAAVRLQGRAGAAPRRRRAADAGGASCERPRSLAVWKFASCDGCQLSLLDCEDELLALAGELDIAYFLEAGPERRSRAATTSRSSRARSPRPHDAERIREIRARSRRLITIGACATAGGIQALRNFADVDGLRVARLRRARSTSRTLRDSTPGQRARRGRLRAAGLPARQAPAARGHQRLPQRAPARDRRPQRLRRVQAPRQRLRDGRPRHAVPGPGDARRLRRAVPELPPRLLRLLRADGGSPTPASLGALAGRPRPARARRRARCTAPSTRAPRRSGESDARDG